MTGRVERVDAMDPGGEPGKGQYEAGREPVVDIGPEKHLTYLMAQAVHQLERRLDHALAAVGLTTRQFSALAHIARGPGLSSTDLSKKLLITPQAANKLISRLEAAGLIDRASTASRQPLALSLSPSGIAALRRAEPLASRTEIAALKLVDPKDLESTHRAVRRLLTLSDAESADRPDHGS